MRLNQRRQKALIGLIISLLITALGYGLKQEQLPRATLGINTPGNYTVSEISDGDTIVVDMNGTKEKIRLIGVDTPETQDPRKPVQCFGQAATNFTSSLIGTSAVRLEADTLSSNRDRYNRLLRYVYLPNGQLVNAEIIRQGYGFAYTSFPFEKAEEFRRLEREAREANRGLWGNCNPTLDKNGHINSSPL